MQECALAERLITYDTSTLDGIKAAAGFAKTRFRGTERVNAAFTLATAAYNLVRLPKLLARPT